METSYDSLFDLLIQAKNEQLEEFSDVIDYVTAEQLDSSICELVAQLSQKKVQYTTYSHV